MTLDPNTQALCDNALACVRAGVSVLPIDHATKRPASNLLPRDTDGKATWKPYQQGMADEATVRRWFASGCQAYAVVCGKVSSGLLVLDFDAQGFYERWAAAVGELAAGLPVQQTGGGGFQVLLRCPEPGGNLKLAWAIKVDEATGRTIAIETRGEGGYAVMAPSLHPSGNRYVWLIGDAATVPTITQEHADKLLNAARALDNAPMTRQERERSEAQALEAHQRSHAKRNGQASVIDAYNAKYSIENSLELYGYAKGPGGRFVRPGGQSESVSVKDGRSCHWSSDDPLANGHGPGGCGCHDAFDLYAHYEHAGDTRSAVRAAAGLLEIQAASNGPATPAAEAPEPPTFEPVNFLTLVEQRPERGPVVIDGILREGAVGTLVSGTKGRKSFAVAALVAATLSGGTWFGHNVTPGRVALIDGELTLGTIYFRLRKVFEAMGLDSAAIGAGLDVYALRGRTKDAGLAIATIRAKGPGYYKTIIVDPLYCFYPDTQGFSENDNAAMRQVYDKLIGVAGETHAALMVVHHLSKGAQGDKGVTDLGSGAGAISRAGDAHLAFRQHAEKDAVVFDGVVRDFPELEPSVWRWSFPLFTHAPDLNPDDLAGKRPRRSVTADFMADAKPDPADISPADFAAKYIPKDDGKELVWIQAKAADAKLTDRAIDTLVRKAVALGKAHKWRGGPGKPTRFSLTPMPVTETAK